MTGPSGSRRIEADTARIGATLSGMISPGLRRVMGGMSMSLTSLSTMATLERTGPRRVTDLAFTQGVTQPAMTAVIRSLERSGLVERRDDPADGRVALIAITASGIDVLQERRRSGAEGFERLIEKLPAKEVKTLIAALPALEHIRLLAEADREPPTRPSDGPPSPLSGPR
jgi:DNA-binding MarR family transcriptional regulator